MSQYHTIYVLESSAASGTIPFEAGSDADAISRGKELARTYTASDGSIAETIPNAGDTYCVEWTLFRKSVHSHHHDDYEMLGVERTAGADYVSDWALDIERMADGGINITDA